MTSISEVRSVKSSSEILSRAVLHGENGGSHLEWPRQPAHLGMVTVKVINRSSGKPTKGKKVALGISGLFSGGVTLGEWTDSNGEAHFEVKPNNGKVFIDGSKRCEGHLSGRI